MRMNEKRETSFIPDESLDLCNIIGDLLFKINTGTIKSLSILAVDMT